jgi:hypothetical protein
VYVVVNHTAPRQLQDDEPLHDAFESVQDEVKDYGHIIRFFYCSAKAYGQCQERTLPERVSVPKSPYERGGKFLKSNAGMQTADLMNMITSVAKMEPASYTLFAGAVLTRGDCDSLCAC